VVFAGAGLVLDFAAVVFVPFAGGAFVLGAFAAGAFVVVASVRVLVGWIDVTLVAEVGVVEATPDGL
jgi:hypothetical protein